MTLLRAAWDRFPSDQLAVRKGWWLPLVVLTSSLVLSTVDHEMVPTSFGFYWYVFWLPLGLAAAAAPEPSSGSDAPAP